MEMEYFREQLREQDEELSLLIRLSTIITSSMNIQEVFQGFAEELERVISVDYATVVLIEEDQLRILAQSSYVKPLTQLGQLTTLKGTTTDWVAKWKRSLYEADLTQHKRFPSSEHYIKMGIGSAIHLPLIVRDRAIGSLTIASCQSNAYDLRQIRLLERVALQIAIPIENAQLYAKAEQRARIDELTGLFNRRHFEQRLKEEIERHSKHGDVFSLFMLDLDYFKIYNDMYGHRSGDELLAWIGAIIRNSIGRDDQAFRYGGDEFMAILASVTVEDAYQVAKRVREHVAAAMKTKKFDITCSIGLASYPSDGVSSGELVNAADTALYYAKCTGGNRVYLPSRILSQPAPDVEIGPRRSGFGAVRALVSAAKARDSYMYVHSKKVSTYAVALAEAISLPPDEVVKISAAALLHDIGKVGIPDKILKKRGALTAEDWEVVKFHPRMGANIVGSVSSLVPCLPTILYHHEHWDGTGYPGGLKGETIPLGARIVAIADAFATLTFPRSYRKAFSSEEALKVLEKGGGTQFDPKLVQVFLGSYPS